MRACIQRVSECRVTVEGRVVGDIAEGLLVLLGVTADDDDRDLRYMVDKIVELRVFEDADGKMNVSLRDSGGAMLVVSQFTLLGDCRKGRRPSFIAAAEPGRAEQMYEAFVGAARAKGIPVSTGQFRAQMQVALVNDGPVTILLDSKKDF